MRKQRRLDSMTSDAGLLNQIEFLDHFNSAPRPQVTMTQQVVFNILNTRDWFTENMQLQ